MSVRHVAGAITMAFMLVGAWSLGYDVVLPPWVEVLASISMTIWFVSEAEHKNHQDQAANRDQTDEAVAQLNAVDWCEGCDQLRPRTQMGLNSIWLYRCHECRSDASDARPGYIASGALGTNTITSDGTVTGPNAARYRSKMQQQQMLFAPRGGL